LEVHDQKKPAEKCGPARLTNQHFSKKRQERKERKPDRGRERGERERESRNIWSPS